MDDLISRQAAIDALESIGSLDTDADREYARSIFEQLPSVQPEKRTEKRTETHACDLIDREAAVDAIYHHLPSVSRTEVRLMLHEVPSAQPEIIRCKDCRWRKDQSGSTAWLPCRAIVTPSDFYCGRAERRTDG